MSSIEKSVFISYRRTNSYHALAIYQALIGKGYDVFIDYEGIDSGKFDEAILNQIKARAHFVVILTPSALERCDDPNDWVRIEILTAMDSGRNIVPVMFDGFDWKADIIEKLPDALRGLARYNALPVPTSMLYFGMAMELLDSKFLNKPVTIIIHPTPQADVQVVKETLAIATNQPAVTEHQLLADSYFERGNQYYFNGQYEACISEYTESLRYNPHNPTAYYRRGIAYQTLGQTNLASADHDQAIIEADVLIQLNPFDAEVYRARGATYDEKGDYDRAIVDYNEAIRLNPQFALAYINRGNAYASKRDDDRALIDYGHAIRLNPNMSLVYNNRGIIYRKRGEFDRAIADYSEAIRLNPNSAPTYNNRGWAYFMKEDYDRAIADFDHALQLNPKDELAKNNRDMAIREKNR